MARKAYGQKGPGQLRKLKQITEQLGTVKREGLAEQVVYKMRALVLRGTLLPGERLPGERDLARMLSVSRSSLRQALKSLQVMGVLEVQHGSGNYLTSCAKEILEQPAQVLVPLPGLSQAELFEVRRAMETEAAAAAAGRASEKDLERIRAELDGMRRNQDDRYAYGKHDLAFHHAIAVASGNRYFIWFLDLANRLLYKALLQRPMRRGLDLSLKEHEDIYNAIERHDANAAREEMLNHISYQKFYDGTPADIRFLAYEAVERQEADLTTPTTQEVNDISGASRETNPEVSGLPGRRINPPRQTSLADSRAE